QVGLEPLAAETCACPVVATFVPPGGEPSEAFVARCQSWGYAIGGQSGYLAARGLVQIATMGAVTQETCVPLFEHLRCHSGPSEMTLARSASEGGVGSSLACA